MNKVYIFGAGNNAYGVVSYIGCENVIAIIDNEKKKQGDRLLGIPIISLNEYVAKNNNEQIVISAAIYNEIIIQLEERNIYNYSVAPILSRGMVSPEEIYIKCGLEKDREIVIFGSNIVSDKFIDYITQNHKDLRYEMICDSINEVHNDFNYRRKVIVFKENIELRDKEFLSNFQEICDVYEIIGEERKEKMSKLIRFKDKHKDERCFIVCNGPSLRISDLEKLYDNNIYTFGCNLIFKMYSDTYWRPNAYVITEFGLYKTYYDEIRDLKKGNNEVFVKGICEIEQMKELDGINYYYEDCRRKYYENEVFSDDIVRGVYSGYTVAYDMIQIAVYMGFSEIYLIGADFNYNGDAAQKGNHVYDSKFQDKRKMAGRSYIDCSINAMEVSRKYAEAHGIKIYNATRGGKLEVFERKELDELFKGYFKRAN